MSSEQKKPWWQMTRTPTPGFVLGGFWLVYASFRWFTLDSGGRFALVTACVFTVLGLCFLASSAAVLRRRRAADHAARPEGRD